MENLDEKIESYILGDLPQNERTAFEKALTLDPNLVKSVAQHREIMARLEALRIRKKVESVLPSRNNRHKLIPVFTISTYWAVAASLVLVAAALWFFKQSLGVTGTQMANHPIQSTKAPSLSDSSGQEPTVQNKLPAPMADAPAQKPAENRMRMLALAREYHQHPNASMLRDIESSADPSGPKTITQLAASAFYKDDFALAALLLHPDSTVMNDETAQYLRANARFQIGQFTGAAADFDALQNSFQLKHDARWNFMLCQLALGKLGLVKPLLAGMVAEEDYPFQDKAVALKASLNF